MIRKRGNRYQVSITTRDPETGRNVQLSRTVDTKREAEAAENELRKEARKRTVTASTRAKTVGALLDDWLALNVAGRAFTPGGATSTRNRIECYLRPRFGDVRLDRLTTREINRFYRDLQTQPS